MAIYLLKRKMNFPCSNHATLRPDFEGEPELVVPLMITGNTSSLPRVEEASTLIFLASK